MTSTHFAHSKCFRRRVHGNKYQIGFANRGFDIGRKEQIYVPLLFHDLVEPRLVKETKTIKNRQQYNNVIEQHDKQDQLEVFKNNFLFARRSFFFLLLINS